MVRESCGQSLYRTDDAGERGSSVRLGVRRQHQVTSSLLKLSTSDA
jgi:hypothetical protein